MFQALHEKAKAVSQKYKSVEKELIDILSEIDSKRAYLELGYSSLFQYAVKFLGLSEDETCRFTQVVRKSHVVPELKEVIGQGLLTVSKASRIVSVITPENKNEWIQKAIELPHRELERAVAVENPKLVRREQLKVVTDDRVELRVSLTKQAESDLRRAQEVFRTKSLEETIEALLNFALSKKDPVRNADRLGRRVSASSVAAGPSVSPASGPTGKLTLCEERPASRQVARQLRTPIPAAIKHQVFQRDRGACQFRDCGEKRWTEIHHLRPVSLGGDNSVENLATVCSSHHKYVHHGFK